MDCLSKKIEKAYKRIRRVPDRFLWWIKIRSVINSTDSVKKNNEWDSEYTKSVLHHSHQNKLISLDFIRQAKKRDVFVGLFKKTDSLLELGCGTGELSNFISKSFEIKKLIGLEISQAAVNMATALYANENISYVKINPTESLSGLGQFDLAICSQVLEHFLRPHEIIDKMFKVAPVVIVIVPYSQVITDGYKEEGGSGHVFMFTEKSFEKYDILDSFIFETLGWDYSSVGERPSQLAVAIKEKKHES